ncbi:hypothetical protein NE237_015574 [Protea cynaroides]|uniref:Uncharacterized protein n=1 Tax=Protea cynaroides TaxID=273540 RepID=A0A9Q0KE33_9MAGN|nr:hypothetical protein NE237_015574 [Protea cynaroides]
MEFILLLKVLLVLPEQQASLLPDLSELIGKGSLFVVVMLADKDTSYVSVSYTSLLYRQRFEKKKSLFVWLQHPTCILPALRWTERWCYSDILIFPDSVRGSTCHLHHLLLALCGCYCRFNDLLLLGMLVCRPIGY